MIEEKFLIDANSFMTPYQNFYPFDITPGFWKQFKKALSNDSVSVLDVVKAEIKKGDDELTDWISAMSDLKIIDRRDQSIMVKYGLVLSYLQNSPLYNDKALRAWSDVKCADLYYFMRKMNISWK